VVHEQAGQVEQSGEPGDNENYMQRFKPEHQNFSGAQAMNDYFYLTKSGATLYKTQPVAGDLPGITTII
jgi:hypothetical protein